MVSVDVKHHVYLILILLSFLWWCPKRTGCIRCNTANPSIRGRPRSNFFFFFFFFFFVFFCCCFLVVFFFFFFIGFFFFYNWKKKGVKNKQTIKTFGSSYAAGSPYRGRIWFSAFSSIFQNASFISVSTSLGKILRVSAAINVRILAKLLRINAAMNFNVRIALLNEKLTIGRMKFNQPI